MEALGIERIGIVQRLKSLRAAKLHQRTWKLFDDYLRRRIPFLSAKVRRLHKFRKINNLTGIKPDRKFYRRDGNQLQEALNLLLRN